MSGGARRRRWRGRPGVAAALAAALVAGQAACSRTAAGGGDGGALTDPGRFASPAAVCALLAPDDLAQALGFGYQAGVGLDFSNAFLGLPGVTRCLYEPDGEYVATGAGTVQTGVVYAYAEQILADAVRRGSDARRFRRLDVPGTVYWDTQGKELLALADGRIFAVLVPSSGAEPEADVIERARRLAAKALERL